MQTLQQDTTFRTQHFHIFPTITGMYDLAQYNPAEMTQVIMKMQNEHEEFILDEFPNLKKAIDECILFYCQETGLKLAEVTSYHVTNLGVGDKVEMASYDDSFLTVQYYPIFDEGSADLWVQSPFNVPRDHVEKTTLATAPSEKFVLSPGRCIIYPSSVKHFTEENPTENRVCITFKTKRK